MKFLSNVSKEKEILEIVRELTRSSDSHYDIGVLFVTARSQSEVKELCDQIKSKIKIKSFIACTCAGIIGNNEEIENQAGASLLLAQLPNTKIIPFYLNQNQLEQLTTKEKWYEFFDIYPNENPVFLTLPDPFEMDLNAFINGLNNAYGASAVVGGLASGAHQPGGNVLVLNNEYYQNGAIGLILKGGVKINTVVSQGCRPIGETFIITKAKGNIIYELAGKKFYKVIQDVFAKVSDRDRQLAQQAVFVGIVMNEYKHELKRGDFLIRQIIGIDEATEAGVVGDHVETGQTIQFQLRDAQTAQEDLNELLSTYKKQSNLNIPQAAFVFSCNGRGIRLFGQPNHDINIIQKYLGPIPAAGFFCAGEIGPVYGKNFLHGFTDSIVLFS